MTTAALFGTRDAASQRLRAHHERHQAAGRDEWAYRAVLDLEATFGMPAEAAMLIVAREIGTTDLTGGGWDGLATAFRKTLPRMKAPSLCVRGLFPTGTAWGAMSTGELDRWRLLEPGMPLWRSECSAQMGDRATWFTSLSDAHAHAGERIVEGRLARGHLDAIALVDLPVADDLMGKAPVVVSHSVEVLRPYRPHPMPSVRTADDFRQVARALAALGLVGAAPAGTAG